MPAKEIMPLFKAGQLHSGSSEGPIVKNPHQATAIKLDYLRKEGHKIGEPKPHGTRKAMLMKTTKPKGEY